MDVNSVIERRFYSRPFCQIVSSLFFPPCIHYKKKQLFQGRLLEKVHATIPKGIVGAVLSSLFFKEICKNGTRDHKLMFAIAKEKQQK